MSLPASIRHVSLLGLDNGRSRLFVVRRVRCGGDFTLTRNDRACRVALTCDDGIDLDGETALWLADRLREAARGLPWPG